MLARAGSGLRLVYVWYGVFLNIRSSEDYGIEIGIVFHTLKHAFSEIGVFKSPEP